MFTLKLRVLPRVLLKGLLNQYMQSSTRSLSELSALIKLNDKLAFTAEEQAAVNYRTEKNEQTGNAEVRWNYRAEGKEEGEVVDIERDVELSDEQKEMLYTAFKDQDERKAFGVENASVMLELAEKLGYEFKKE